MCHVRIIKTTVLKPIIGVVKIICSLFIGGYGHLYVKWKHGNC